MDKVILKAQAIVNEMYKNDDFSKWLGVEFMEVLPGSCTLRMKVRDEMTNGFDILHGGISYSFADSALAFASNSQGKIAVSIETSISHLAAVHTNDILTAIANEDHLSSSLANYTIRVSNQDSKLVAFFKGTVYRKREEWDV